MRILDATEAISELATKIGVATLRSVGHIARLQRIADNDIDSVTQQDMIAELLDDNRQLAHYLRGVHILCSGSGDATGATLLENWIHEAEDRAWSLDEAMRCHPHGYPTRAVI
jgi:starvation-inducible DNA-binding protein